jgi:hypothetical protein
MFLGFGFKFSTFYVYETLGFKKYKYNDMFRVAR